MHLYYLDKQGNLFPILSTVYLKKLNTTNAYSVFILADTLEKAQELADSFWEGYITTTKIIWGDVEVEVVTRDLNGIRDSLEDIWRN